MLHDRSNIRSAPSTRGAPLLLHGDVYARGSAYTLPMSSPTLINTKLVFRTYAVLAAVLGAIGLAGNLGVSLGAQLQPALLVVHPADASPWGQYVVPRLAGTVLIMAALIALAFARLDDAEARRGSLNRFAIAHVVFGFLFRESRAHSSRRSCPRPSCGHGWWSASSSSHSPSSMPRDSRLVIRAPTHCARDTRHKFARRHAAKNGLGWRAISTTR
jgi:hypothetical protein